MSSTPRSIVKQPSKQLSKKQLKLVVPDDHQKYDSSGKSSANSSIVERRREVSKAASSGKSENSDSCIPSDIKKSFKYTPAEVGPVQKRSCRDIFFLILFIAFWGGMFYIASIGIAKGDPNRLLIPSDSFGQFCGVDNSLKNSSQRNLTSKPYLYFFLPFQPTLSKKICIEKCPNSTYITNTTNPLCTYDKEINGGEDLVNAVKGSECAPFVIASESILGRCVPVSPLPADYLKTVSSINLTTVNSSYSIDSIVNEGRDAAFQIATELSKNSSLIAIGAVFAIVLSFLWIVLLRWFAAPLTWLSILLCNAGMIGLSVWLYLQWGGNLDTSMTREELSELQSSVWQLQGSAILFGVSVALTGILLLISVAIRKKVKTAIAVIKEASIAIFKIPSILLLPFFQFLTFGGLSVYFILILMYLVTASEQFVLGEEVNKQFTIENLNSYLCIYHLFGYLWTAAVLIGLGQVITAGCVASYYWTFDKSKIQSAQLYRNSYRAIVYHLGSVCIGALLLAVVQLFSFLLWVFRLKAKGQADNSKILSCLLCCVQCLLKCLESVVKWINRNAYIYIAISGQGFCKSAYMAFKLIVRNATKILAVNMVADFLLTMCKLFITAIAFGGSWAVIKYFSPDTNFIIIPSAIIAAISYFISSIFFGVYKLAIETIFLCYLEDLEKNDGSDDHPYYFTPRLQEIVSGTSKGKN